MRHYWPCSRVFPAGDPRRRRYSRPPEPSPPRHNLWGGAARWAAFGDRHVALARRGLWFGPWGWGGSSSSSNLCSDADRPQSNRDCSSNRLPLDGRRCSSRIGCWLAPSPRAFFASAKCPLRRRCLLRCHCPYFRRGRSVARGTASAAGGWMVDRRNAPPNQQLFNAPAPFLASPPRRLPTERRGRCPSNCWVGWCTVLPSVGRHRPPLDREAPPRGRGAPAAAYKFSVPIPTFVVNSPPSATPRAGPRAAAPPACGARCRHESHPPPRRRCSPTAETVPLRAGPLILTRGRGGHCPRQRRGGRDGRNGRV